MSPVLSLFLVILLVGVVAHLACAIVDLVLRALGAPLGMRLMVFLPVGVLGFVLSSQPHVPRTRRLAALIIGLAAFFRAGMELYRNRREPGRKF